MTLAQRLAGYFSDYRSEWEHEQFSSLFVEPAYYATLLKRRPSLLIGGRGTGKTTTLKALRFDAFEGRALASAPSPPFLGIYLRINKNRVSAFQGDELSHADWTKAFAHYFNLLACLELSSLAAWLLHRMATTSTPLDLSLVQASLSIPPSMAPSVEELRSAVVNAIVALELYVNNPAAVPRPTFSMSEAPLKHFGAALKTAGLLGEATIFCCVDEYENLTETQQSVVNTYLKHSEPPITYKIGLRRNGLKTHATIDENDQIATPDDYDEVDVSSAGFDTFAYNVAARRLRHAAGAGVPVPASPEQFLPELSADEEAELLGGGRKAESVRRELEKCPELAEWLSLRTDRELVLLSYWQAGHGSQLLDLAHHWLLHPTEWHTRLGNYGQSSLFWLSVGRKGARIRKYFSGLKTFLSLASGNIRYFLELIDNGIDAAVNNGEFGDGSEGCFVVSPESQTQAAMRVGKRRLSQIEEVGRCGADLRRYVLAIGKVFLEFARDPTKSPETNCFVLSGAPAAREKVESILSEGVANQVFEVTPKTKATSQYEMRDDEYRVHPIFCPFFEFSHRKKRRTSFSAEDLLLIRTNPRQAIAALSGVDADSGTHNRRPGSSDSDLPPQLEMFADFFGGGPGGL